MKNIDLIYKILKETYKNLKQPSVTQISKNTKKNPYKVLISTIISLRTKDEVTLRASEKLFSVANNPYEMIKLKNEEIEKLIYPAGFYRNKAKTILEISLKLIKEYDAEVPSNIDELLKFKGVGRKTANLVLVEGFGIDAVCVDIHVHRICNRIGLVKTKNPNETEFALRKTLPKRYWIDFNEILVAFGQKICCPVSPYCSKCPLDNYCKKMNINKRR
jgi:endonuclease-3